MPYWKIIDKKAEHEVKNVKHFLVGPPGRSKWVYILENEETKEKLPVAATSDFKTGTRVHAEDIKSIR